MKTEAELTDENAPDRAVALEYRDAAELPRVLLSGTGRLAKQIIALAHQHDIPVQQDGDLVQALSGVSTGQAISPESLELVAEILSFLYVTDEDWRREHEFLQPIIPLPEEVQQGSD